MTASLSKELSRPRSWRHAVADFVASAFGHDGGDGWRDASLAPPPAGLAISLAYEIDGQICTPLAPIHLAPGRPILARPLALGLPAADASRARWQVIDAAALPAGLALDMATGALCGTPPRAGHFTLHIRFSLSGYLGSIEAQFEFYA